MKSLYKHPGLFYARLYYFAYMGSWGFVLPFMNLFYTSLGFNGKQIGAIASTGALVGLMAAPVVVSQIKKSPNARTFLQVLILLGGLGYLLIGSQSVFLPILFVVFLQTLASSSILPLSDSMAVSVSQSADSGYGSIRVWGSLGWILIVPTSGWLIEHYGFMAGFSGVNLGWLLAIGLLFFIPFKYFNPNITLPTARLSLRESILKVVRHRTLLGFAIALIAIGFLNSGVLQFENVFLSDLGASKQLISIAGILSAVVELPFMLLSDRIVRRIGAHKMLLIAILMTMLQRSIVLLWPSIPTIMIVRFIGGVAFSFYTISYIGLISGNTEPSETSTVLALFTVTLAGLVNVVASPVAGALYDLVGARWLYALSAVGYAIAAASLWFTRPEKT